MVETTSCTFVSLNDYDWSFNRVGPLPWNPTVFSIIAAFSALAIWSTVELTVRVFFTFKKRNGLYFWSILGTTWGVTLHAVGFLLKLFAPQVNWIFSTVLAEIGWIGMVSGFSIVLYSRLHLVCQNQKTLRFVLIMIIVDAFLFHTLTVVTQFGLSSGHAHHKWASIMAPMERVQVTAFTIQETIISGLYMWETWLVLKGRFNVSTQTWKVMFLLFTVQVIVILIDVVIITLDYVEYFTLKAIIHSWVYGVKLQLEFVVLNQLVDVATNGLTPNGLATISDSNLDSPSTGTTSPKPILAATDNEKKNWFSKSKSIPAPTSQHPALQQSIPSLSIYNPHDYQPAAAIILSSPITSPGETHPGLAYEPRQESSETTLQRQLSDGSTTSLQKVGSPPRWHNSGNDTYGSATDISDLERQYIGRGTAAKDSATEVSEV